MKKYTVRILLLLVMCMFLLPVTAFAENSQKETVGYNLWVGGEQITSLNAADVFCDGTVSYNAETKTLTLNNYCYEGNGYLYNKAEDDSYFATAAIYSADSLNIQLKGDNLLRNTFNDLDANQYGDGVCSGDGVCAGGDLAFCGDGSLQIQSWYGIFSEKHIDVSNCSILVDAGDTGIYAYEGISITDSIMKITAAKHEGIYSFDGGVTIDCTDVTVSPSAPALCGTKLSITVTDEEFPALSSDIEPLVISDLLNISTPAGGKVQKINDIWDSDDDGIEETPYVLYTVVDADGNRAISLVIEPLGYSVAISGLSHDMSVLVPAGQSVNEAYRDIYGFEDFSEILDTSKENHRFVGWYTDPTFTAGSEFDFNKPVTEDITIVAKYVPVTSGFTDVAEESYYYDAVDWAVAKGITFGTSETTFAPNAPCTRAQMATFLWRAAGSPEPVGSTNLFTDVPADAYYAKAVQWAYEKGITGGTSADTFSPDATCTRAQMATFLWRAAGSPEPVGSTNPFTDVSADAYYAKAVQWAYEKGITSGTSTTTASPDDPCPRAQMVTFLYRYFVK